MGARSVAIQDGITVARAADAALFDPLAISDERSRAAYEAALRVRKGLSEPSADAEKTGAGRIGRPGPPRTEGALGTALVPGYPRRRRIVHAHRDGNRRFRREGCTCSRVRLGALLPLIAKYRRSTPLGEPAFESSSPLGAQGAHRDERDCSH